MRTFKTLAGVTMSMALTFWSCAGAPPQEVNSEKSEAPSPAPVEVSTDAGMSATTADAGRCGSIEEMAHSVWSDQILSKLDFSVKIYNGEMQAADAELAVSRLNAFTERWIAMRRLACEEGTEERTELLDCMDEALQTQRVVVTDMETGAKMAVAQAQTLPELLNKCDASDARASDMRDNPF